MRRLSRTVFFEVATGAVLGIVLFTFVLFLRSAGRLFDGVAALLGLREDDLLSSPMWVDTGADQLLVPLRYWLYPRELFWTEEGYRFSWRVMLMEKMGQVEFKVVDSATGQTRRVNNSDHLSVLQEKMMATQADMILQFAHYLRDYYARQGVHQPQVYADTYVSLNGRLGKAYIDPTVDLARQAESFAPKPWIFPFEDEMSGL